MILYLYSVVLCTDYAKQPAWWRHGIDSNSTGRWLSQRIKIGGHNICFVVNLNNLLNKLVADYLIEAQDAYMRQQINYH